MGKPFTGYQEGFRERRLSFGAVAGDYDALRPSYPEEALRWVVGGPPRRVLDLGSGTGRLGVLLQKLGMEVVAVEPDAAMRAIAARALPGVVLEGTAEQIPLSDASVDAVVVGQAWHWFDPARAAPEIARVLRPGGALGVFWNLKDEQIGWVAALGELVGGEARSSTWPSELDLGLGQEFAAVERQVFQHQLALSPGDLVRLAGTWSYVNRRTDAAEVLARVDELARTHPELAGRDTVQFPFQCVVHKSARR